LSCTNVGKAITEKATWKKSLTSQPLGAKDTVPRDIAECDFVEDFLETLQLKKIPERKVRKALSMA